MKITKRLGALAVMGVAVAVLLAACGEDDTGSSAESAPGNGIDRPFATEMIPHHHSAVEMAEFAQKRSTRREIQRLAAAIISSQTAEIDRLTALYQRLKDAGVPTGELGMAEHDMGMDADASMLSDAERFDREFIDMMIAHHQGAIRMARVELEKGDNPELQGLAEAIVDAQAKEIDKMNTWRVEWFGAMSPVGGVPADEEPQEDDGGGHDGHGM